MYKEIKFNDLKTIGYSFKVSTNDVEDIWDNLQKEDMIIDGEVITRISFKDQKSDSPKESSEDKYITYTVVDYKDDVKYATGLSCVKIILSVSNRKENVVLLFPYDFLNNNFLTRLSDDIDVLVVF